MHRFACVVLVDSRGWVLLQERDEHPVIDPEKWGSLGGHVERGEDFEPAAYRELAEETGIRLASGELRLFGGSSRSTTRPTATLDDDVPVYVARIDSTDADIECRRGAADRLRRPRLRRPSWT